MSAATLNHTLRQLLSLKMATIDDPGASGTFEIPALHGFAICEVTTAGAESRALPSATRQAVGQVFAVVFKDDGGDLTITGAETSVVLDSAGDIALFYLSDNDGTKAWRILTNTTMVGSVATLLTDLSTVEANATVIPDAQQEEIAAGNPGAISVATYLTRIGADAGGDAFTLADGTTVGQLKKITMDDATGTGTVTIASPADENTLAFDAVGETAILRWNGTGWRIVSAYNEADGADGPGLSTV